MSPADRYQLYAALLALQVVKEPARPELVAVEEPQEPLLVRQCFDPLPSLH